MSGKEAGRVKQWLNALNRTDRYVVLLYYADDLTPTEISLVLDIPKSRVTQTLEWARNQVTDLVAA